VLEAGSTLHLQHLELADGEAVTDGGVIHVQGVLEIEDVSFSNNFQDGMPRALTNHGLVWVMGGTSTMQE